MATLLAYFSVVLIWATTPLAIQWSSDSLHFMAAGVARMSLALFVALLINAVFNRAFFAIGRNWKIYFAASLGIFPNLPLVYWGAQFIPSGLVAVIYAMSPFVTGLMTLWLLKQNSFTLQRIVALIIALAGLVVIFYHQLQFDRQSAWGIIGVFASCCLFSFSSVWVKKISIHNDVMPVNAFYQTTGALLFSLPGLLVGWWLLDGHFIQPVSFKSAAAVVYLAMMGSLVGGVLFFYILQRLSPPVVSLITLMTPVLAILIGKFLADEVLSLHTLSGVVLVLCALLLYMQSVLRTFCKNYLHWVKRACGYKH